MAPYSVILFILLNIHLGTSFEIICVYGDLYVLDIERIHKVYSCKGRINSRSSLDRITGIHSGNKTDEDVKGFQMINQGLSYFIRNINETFPNLEQINLSFNEITQLTNEDLGPHTNLEYFMINVNFITSLNSNLFDNLLKFKEFHFVDNELKNVQHEIKLPPNAHFYFQNNTCINSDAESEEEIVNLKFEFLLKCPPTMSQIEETIAIRENLFTKLRERNSELKRKLNFLEEQHRKILNALGNK